MNAIETILHEEIDFPCRHVHFTQKSTGAHFGCKKMFWREVGKHRLSDLVSRRISYPSMKILIANSICNVALSRFPHPQVSVVAKKKYNFWCKNRAQKNYFKTRSDLTDEREAKLMAVGFVFELYEVYT